ncbi:MAG TPA: HAD-IIIA family hydrolase, partial [candidate division Zixibacteria bacterium]|nr:HAD-IIIA family hydrolase [candidate division Zixibacteria bacterium]
SSDMEKILVIRFGSLGDVILTSAAVLNLKISFPGSRLTFFTKERFGGLAAAFDGVDEVVCLPEGGDGRELVRLALELDRRGFDAVADLHGNFRSWLTRKMVTAPHATVYPKRRLARRRLLRGRNRLAPGPHTIDLYNQAVRAIGGKTPARRPLLPPPVPDADLPPSVREFLGRHQVCVAAAPGAAHRPKQWPVERFAAAAAELHRTYGAGIVWIATSAEQGKGPKPPAVAPEHCVELVDRPIGEIAAVLRRCTATLANDSGIAHLSSAVGTPAAVVFGPTHPALGFAPRGLCDRVLEVEEYCRPCSLHGEKACFREEPYCLTRISPEAAAEAVADLIARRQAERPAILADRDGTVMADKEYLGDPAGVELVPGAAESLRAAQARGYRIVILSNQSGVARGLFAIEAVERVNARLRDLLARAGVRADGMYYCPHYEDGAVREYAAACGCRKPAAGMAEQAARELGIDLRRSSVIGDKADDVNLARVMGGRGVLVRTGHGAAEEAKIRAAAGAAGIAVAEDLAAAVKLVMDGDCA